MPSFRSFSLALLATAAALPVWADQPRVVTDIAPVQGLVSMVMEGVATPELVVPPNGSPHDYAMRPSQARSLSAADLVVWVGPGLTGFLEGPIGTLAGDAAEIRLMEVPGTLLLPMRESIGVSGHEGHDHGAEAGDADHGVSDHGDAEHDEEPHGDHDDAHDGDEPAEGLQAEGGHDHAGGVDPHVWLDPRNGALWLTEIAETLAAIDPENAETYRANAEAGQARLADLEQEISDTLAPVREVPYVVLHDAYHYFEDRFDLRPVAAVATSDAARPGAARLSGLRGEIAEAGPVCAFREPQMPLTLLETATEGQKVTFAQIDPLGATLEPGAAQYETLLRRMAQDMADCLSARRD